MFARPFCDVCYSFCLTLGLPQFLKQNRANSWCEQNFINRRALEKAERIELQLLDIVDADVRGGSGGGGKRRGATAAADPERRVVFSQRPLRPQQIATADWERWMRRLMVKGLFMFVAVREKRAAGAADGGGGDERGAGGGGGTLYRTVLGSYQVRIHPQSCMVAKLPDCVLYTELQYTNQAYLRGVHRIEYKWLTELVPSACALVCAAAAVGLWRVSLTA